MIYSQADLELSDLTDEQERAIRSHPVEVSTIYFTGRDAFLSATKNDKPVLPENASFSVDDLLLFHRYMLSSSFISAWYHLRGEKEKRDKAAHSCATLISSYGVDATETMKKYIKYEQLWRRQIRSAQVLPVKAPLFKIILGVVVLIALMLFLFF